MSKSIYISSPYSLRWDTVIEYEALLNSQFHVDVWNRKEKYNDSPLKQCDIFLLLTNDNKWNIDINHLPSGCRRELLEAIQLGKPILLGY
jgi:hypothetical protein